MTPPAPSYGPTNPPLKPDSPNTFCQVIELVPEKEQAYRDHHAKVWPRVVQRIHEAGLRDYSIFTVTLGGVRYLIGTFTYDGTDLEKAHAYMAECPETQKWWKLMGACQRPAEGNADGNPWLVAERVFKA